MDPGLAGAIAQGQSQSLDGSDDEIGVRAMQAGANDDFAEENLARLGPALARELENSARRQQMHAAKVCYRALLESAQDAILVVDAEGWIKVFNQGAVALTRAGDTS
jgi:PAS domain-containing protein